MLEMMAATELHLDVQNLKPPEGFDSDSDSGQGSCKMGSPVQMSNGVASLDDGDSDEEIYMNNRVKRKKVFTDSENEGQDLSPEKLDVATRDVGNAMEKDNKFAAKTKKTHCVFQPLLESDGSDADSVSDEENLKIDQESGLPGSTLDSEDSEMISKPGKKCNRRKINHVEQMDGKQNGNPRKRRTGREKKMKAIRQIVKKEKKKVEEYKEFNFNDSGCLLADKDLFETGLEEEDEDLGSLESIKAVVKEKMKKQKLLSESKRYLHALKDSEEPPLKPPRKERKAAKLSKEAIRRLHSETQRLIREADISLPYHLPEPKSVHEFFRRKPRLAFQGDAMTLLKSGKYQPGLEVASTALKNPDVHSSENEREEINGSARKESVAGHEPHILSLVNSSIDNVDRHPAGEAKRLREDNLVQNGQDENLKTASLMEECTSEQQEKPHLTGADECSKLTLNKEDNAVERKEKQSPKLARGLKKPELPGLELVAPGKKSKSKLDRLRELGVDLTIKPRLCFGEDSFVDLDEPESNRELEALKERFVKHAFHTTKPKMERVVNLNIICKETTKEGKEELKADVIPVTLGAERLEEAIHAKPGEKLQVLKAKLEEAMKARRSEERQRRQALFKLDNEDMLEEEEEEEEEEEMTTEEEEEEEEEEDNHETTEFLLGESEENNEESEEQGSEDEDKESINEDRDDKTLHCSVVPKSASNESTLLLFKDNSSKTGYSLPGEKAEIEEAASKRTDKPEDEDSFLLPNIAKENSHNSSFELIGSMIPSYQPCNKQMTRGSNFLSAFGSVRSPSPGFFRTSFVSSASKSSGKTSEPSLPIEDSQDLYNATSEEKSPVQAAGKFRFQFSLEDDTQSQLLDADGFLNVGPHQNKNRLPLASMDENAMDTNMHELLDLCSGQFASQNKPQPNSYSSRKQNMEDLLNLCSGKFASQDSPTRASSVSSDLTKEVSVDDPMAEAVALCSGSFPTDREEEEGEEEEFGDFRLSADDHVFENKEDEMSKTDEEEEGEEEPEDEEEDEEELLRHRKGLKRKFKLQDFMEDEAELSGSDGGSEDEYDGEELDEYEEEVLEEALPSEVELQDQVNKIHRKVMQDDDKRQLRLYQERYLADGDLHSDGPGRMRKFRWKHLDDASQMDMFHQDPDNDEETEERLDETEAKWRKERFEREQWLREQSEKGKVEEEEEDISQNSHFMNLAKKVTMKSLQKKVAPAIAVQEIKSLPRNPFETFQSVSNPQLKTGSLLNRPKAVLQKLAGLSDLNPNAPRNSRNFIFHTLSPVKSEEMREKPKPQVKRALVATSAPLPKRLRLDNAPAQETPRSIFQYLER